MTSVDNRLLRALAEGEDALPDDLEQLKAYLVLIGGLLAEKAGECEPDWAQAVAAGAEVETLLQLEMLVVRKAARVQARAVSEVLTKLAIWDAIEPSGEEGEEVAVRDSLVHSIRIDLQRMVAAGRFSEMSGFAGGETPQADARAG